MTRLFPKLHPMLSSAIATASLLGALSTNAFAVEPTDPTLADITNFRQYSATFASSGQPTKDQFSAIAENGFERIVYIAFTNNANALPDADQVVKGLGMEYMHIPVTWDNPLPSDFYAFADSLRRDTDKKTLLHCQVNARATAFSFLYRVIYEGVSIAEAKADMNTVWQPNETWRDLIFAVLAENGMSSECEECDWSPSQM
ncbi:protein tyrosine phosphatase family protein [Gammaproteobacteria bacterium]|nr:protein tyrosine phosphatase family protein [Gammaproteobacteria bacterium]